MIIVVRHGRTAWNATGRSQGWAPISLDAVGLGQAGAAASAVAALVTHPVSVVSSDLPRATATADVIADVLGVGVRCSPELREVDVGRWQGLTDDEVAAVDPDLFQRWKAGEDVRRGGAETYAEAGARVASFLVDLAAASATDVALVVVGHGKSLQWGLDELSARGLVDLGGPAPHLGNGELLVLDDWRYRDAQESRSEVNTALPARSPAE
jgi:probable phosphoglycerate mutase